VTPRTYAELEEHIADCSEWATVHQLEAIAEEELDRLLARFGEDLTDAPEMCQPYGRDYTAPMVPRPESP
jgi:hypothetical protein